MYCLAVLDRNEGASLPSKKAFLSPVKSDWWVCMPEPFSPEIGLGMKVA